MPSAIEKPGGKPSAFGSDLQRCIMFAIERILNELRYR